MDETQKARQGGLGGFPHEPLPQEAQNKKINQLSRRIDRLEEASTTTKLDLEPQGRISMAFESVEEHLSGIDSQLNKMEQNQQFGFNQINAKLEAIMQRLTSADDLPED